MRKTKRRTKHRRKHAHTVKKRKGKGKNRRMKVQRRTKKSNAGMKENIYDITIQGQVYAYDKNTRKVYNFDPDKVDDLKKSLKENKPIGKLKRNSHNKLQFIRITHSS